MIGITIGISPIYEALAKLSAKCFQEMTSLEVTILGEKELLQSGLTHPASLKLKAFDFVEDDNILYFDADWFCTNIWNPTIFSNCKLITACNDFVLKIDFPNQYPDYDFRKFDDYHIENLASHPISEIRNDYINEIKEFSGLKLEFGKWINTGMWIANRKHHQEWLNKSLGYYIGSIGHHPEYYEQPAMNKAIEKLDLKINYLSRKYNTLVVKEKKWSNSLVGMHVKVKHHQDFIEKITSNQIQTSKQVNEYFFNGK
ncbi:MAG: hypothetical protein CVU00_02510 [Bacteroidetes bacterium HGW-Bacteroidetes-17]|jgi:hypothetical protein|nr:MAG: hypothetical protein CVU00_02510 [Bacteroidetes bacterium HGW-Bacteroidetes-17]